MSGTIPHLPPQRPRIGAAGVDRVFEALARALPDGGVRRDPEALEPYATDWSGAGPYPPQLVALPRSTEEVAEVVRTCRRHGLPVVPRGGGTSRAGGPLAVEGGLVLSLEKMDRIRRVDPASLILEADPGVVTLRVDEAAREHGLFYPPDPNSLESCHLGGNVATNAGGPRAVKYGVTGEYVRGLEAVLADGTVIRTGGPSLKSVAGYDLTSLLVGSEGTLAVITGVTVRLRPRPARVVTALLFFADAAAASRAALAVFQAGHSPRTLELMDEVAIESVRGKAPFRFPEGRQTAVLVELDGEGEAPFEELVRLAERCQAQGATEVLVARNETERADLWASRRILSPSLGELYGRKYSEDIAVPLGRIPEAIEGVHAIADRHGLKAALYGHMGDGNLHVNLLFREAEAWPAVMRAAEDVFRLAVSLGGTITGEHGVGLLKRGFLPLEQAGPVIALQRRLKSVLDPDDLLNPGKVLPAEG